jgi:hypothetical protein
MATVTQILKSRMATVAKKIQDFTMFFFIFTGNIDEYVLTVNGR